MRKEKILLVDDEPNVLSGYRRQLRKTFLIDTAQSGAEGLEKLKKDGPYAVVVSDMRMPNMDGVEFLQKTKQNAPESVRVMLTGNADQETAIKAVNKGRIFRFLNKPCSPEMLSSTLLAGIRQYKLETAEKELLEKTLKGSINVLTELLSLTDPEIFGRAEKIKEYVQVIAPNLGFENTWELESAAMLLPIGFVTLPQTLRSGALTGEQFSQQEHAAVKQVPEIGYRLLSKIPRLESVAEIIRYTGNTSPSSQENAPAESSVLTVLSDIVELEFTGRATTDALNTVINRQYPFKPEIVQNIIDIFRKHNIGTPSGTMHMEIKAKELLVGDILRLDLKTEKDQLLLAAGAKVTIVTLERIMNYRKLIGIKEPIHIDR